MNHRTLFAAAIVLLLSACAPTPVAPVSQPAPTPTVASTATPTHTPTVAPTATPESASAVVFPIADYLARRTFKVFGQYVQDRFRGYHTGDDIEYGDISGEVPVYAITDGQVVVRQWVSGYGGVLVIRYRINGKTISALYGHLKLSSAKAVGSKIKKGETIAILGDANSHDTDGERKHLHFQLWEGTAIRFAGYVATKNGLKDYLDPMQFFEQHGLNVTSPTKTMSPS
ncbi:MAG: peptidoglycan DD-metalloendopeptidase family protein [Patescibacteria group bacterium]|nr:peptidoglycan DD-metalloendopeptidase family protein [Patescibacteria group bacterium]